MKIITLKFYQSASGREPVKEWMKALSLTDKKIISEDIKTVEFGWPLGMPLVRKLEKDLWEVRSNLSRNEIGRVFFTVKGELLILVHAIKKKSRKTPLKDLKIARERRNRVFSG